MSGDPSGETAASTPDPPGGGDPDAPDADETTEDGGSREVVVPMRLYKTITVFSTLFAMVGVVAGFVLLDVATNRAGASPSDVDLGLAIAGLGAIVLSGVVYAYSTRFRADRRGRSKADTTEPDDNG